MHAGYNMISYPKRNIVSMNWKEILYSIERTDDENET